MEKIIVVAAYAVYILFCLKILTHALRWYRAAKLQSVCPPDEKRLSLKILLISTIDLLIFRRLFRTNRLLWGASWIFHLTFLLVIMRHASYFLNPVPDFVISIEPVGIAAGHVLPFSLLVIFLIRISESGSGYISRSNMFITGMIFFISIVGLLMRYVFEPDLIAVKDFVMGLLIFTPDIMPSEPVFIIHFVLFLILLPFIPVHLLTVPVVTVNALMREEGLEKVLHEN